MKRASLAALALASIALVGCGESKPSAFDAVKARVYCADLIKQQLRDPDSYQVSDVKLIGQYGPYRQYGNATILFRSKNGFGGYVSGNATCIAYENNGSLWHRAVIN